MIEDDMEFADLLTEFLAMHDIKVTNYEVTSWGCSAASNRVDLISLDLPPPAMLAL